MSSHLKITLIIVGILLFLTVLVLISKKKLPIKYSLFWFFTSIIIILVGAVPNFIGIFTKMIGFETTASLIIGIIVGVLLLITLLLTVIIAEQKRKITLLIQEVSILNKK